MSRSNKSVSKKEYKCCKCGKTTEKIDNFSKVQSDLYDGFNGYLPICKKCLNQLYIKYCDLYHDHYKALKRICQLYDIYYSESIASAVEDYSPTTIATRYIGKINSLNQFSGKTYDNTIEDEEKAQKFITNLSSSDDVDENKAIKPKEIDKEIIDFFGEGFDDSDYLLLEKSYNKWWRRADLDALTVSQEQLLKNICFDELYLHKARLKGDSTKDLEVTYINNIRACGFQPDKEGQSDDPNNDVVGVMLKNFENDDPVYDVDPEFEDVDKIGLLVDVFFKGHTAKCLKINNALSNLYDKFMKKYTVEPPVIDDDEDTEFLFDDIFSSKVDEENAINEEN